MATQPLHLLSPPTLPSTPSLFLLSTTTNRLQIYDTSIKNQSNNGGLKVTLKAPVKDVSVSDSNRVAVWCRFDKSTLGHLSIGHTSGKITVWNISRGISQTLPPFPSSSSTTSASTNPITSLACSHDGNLLYSTSLNDNVINVTKLKTLTLIKKIKISTKSSSGGSGGSSSNSGSGVASIALNNNSKMLAYTVGNSVLRVVDVDSGKTSNKFKVHTSTTSSSSNIECDHVKYYGNYLLVNVYGVNYVSVFDASKASTSTSGEDAGVILAIDSNLVSCDVNVKSGAVVCLTKSGKIHYFEQSQSSRSAKAVVEGGSDVISVQFEPSSGSGSEEGDDIINIVRKSQANEMTFSTISIKNGVIDFTPSSSLSSSSSTVGVKRTADKANVNINVILGAGEIGTDSGISELSSIMSSSSNKKKRSLSTTSIDSNGGGEGREGDNEISIGERLSLLTNDLDNSDDSDDSDSEVTPTTQTNNKTSSLLTILTQALQTNDKAQLEICLQTSDRAVINTTLSQLSPNNVMTLLNTIVALLTKTPSRASTLTVWLHVLLLNHTSMFLANVEMSKKLGPVRNLLEERCKTLGYLVKLEGRLGLLEFEG